MANSVKNPLDSLLKRRGLTTSSNSNTLKSKVSNYEKRIRSVGKDPDEATDSRNWLEKLLNLEEDQNVLFDVFEVLNRPANALLTGIDNALSGDSFTEGLKEGITGETKTTGKDVLLNHTDLDDEEGVLNLSDILGFGLDVVADPLDWVLPGGKSIADLGITAATKGIKKGASVADNLITKGLGKLDDLEMGKVAKRAGGVDKVDDWLKANKLTDKVGTRKVSYEATKRSLKDTFNQAATSFGRLKGVKQVANNQNEMLSELFDKQLKTLDENVDTLAKKRLGINATAEALESEKNKIWEDMLNYIESTKDTSIKGSNILKQLEKGYSLEADAESINTLKNILDEISEKSGRKITYTTDFASDRYAKEIADAKTKAEQDALLRKANTLTIDDIPDASVIKNNPEVRKLFDDANFKYDLRYNTDEQAYINSLLNDADFMDFMRNNQGTQNELNRIIQEATGMDFSEILNRQGYARRARGDISDIDDRLKVIDEQLAVSNLPESTRNALESAKQELENMKKSYEGTSNPFKGRKYNQPALVANREAQERAARNIQNIDEKINYLEGKKFQAQQETLELQKQELINAKDVIKDIKNNVKVDDATGVIAKFKKLNEKLLRTQGKIGKQNSLLENAINIQNNVVSGINDDLINKALKIKDQSISANLVKQINNSNELIKKQDSLLKQIDNIDSLSPKQVADLEKQINKIADDILQNNAKLQKTRILIDNSITDTVEKELNNTSKALDRFEKQVKTETLATSKIEELAEIENQISASLSDLELSINDTINKINFDLKSLSEDDSFIENQIANLQKSKEILNSEAGKQLFNLNYRAGLEDFVKNVEYTNRTSKIFKDALMTNVFNDRETFKLAQDVTEREARNLVKLQGENLATRLKNVSHFITDDRKAIDTVIQSLKGKEFYVDPRVASLFKRVTSSPNETRSILNFVDKINTTFKKFSTLTPGFQMRNIIGNATNMYLSGVPMTAIPKYMSKATEVLNSMDTILDKVAKGVALDATEKTNYKLIQQFYEGGFNRAGTAVRDLEKVAREAKLGGNNLLNQATLFNTRLNESVDSMNRMAALMYANEHPNYVKKLGFKTPTEAVKYALMDPTNMSEAEQNVLKKIIPFYTFTKQNMMFQATNMGKNLKRYKNLMKALNSMYNDLPEDSYYEYQKNNMQIPLPFTSEDGNQLFLKTNLPLSDLGEFLENPIQRLVSSSTPVLKVPFEMATGINTFTGQPNNYTTLSNAAATLGVSPGEGVSDTLGYAEQILNGLGIQNVTTNLVKKLDAVIQAIQGEASSSKAWAEIFRSVLQNVNEENVRNSGLYEDLEKYQAYINQLENQGIDVPTITEMNKSNQIKLNNLKRKRASL